MKRCRTMDRTSHRRVEGREQWRRGEGAARASSEEQACSRLSHESASKHIEGLIVDLSGNIFREAKFQGKEVQSSKIRSRSS